MVFLKIGGRLSTRKIKAPYFSFIGKYEEVFFCSKRFVAARDPLIQMAFYGRIRFPLHVCALPL
jgi:hypothetical protein